MNGRKGREREYFTLFSSISPHFWGVEEKGKFLIVLHLTPHFLPNKMSINYLLFLPRHYLPLPSPSLPQPKQIVEAFLHGKTEHFDKYKQHYASGVYAVDKL